MIERPDRSDVRLPRGPRPSHARLRDGDAHELFSEEMAEELGDVLWYVANLATKLELSLSEVAERNLRKVELDYQMARAECDRRRAELDRALGRIPGLIGKDDLR